MTIDKPTPQASSDIITQMRRHKISRSEGVQQCVDLNTPDALMIASSACLNLASTSHNRSTTLFWTGQAKQHYENIAEYPNDQTLMARFHLAQFSLYTHIAFDTYPSKSSRDKAYTNTVETVYETLQQPEVPISDSAIAAIGLQLALQWFGVKQLPADEWLPLSRDYGGTPLFRDARDYDIGILTDNFRKPTYRIKAEPDLIHSENNQQVDVSDGDQGVKVINLHILRETDDDRVTGQEFIRSLRAAQTNINSTRKRNRREKLLARIARPDDGLIDSLD